MNKSIYWEKKEFNLGILLLCAYHFFPFVTTRGTLLMYAWAYGIPLLYIACNLNYVKRIVSIIARSELMSSVVFLIIISSLSLALPVVYGTNDFTYFTVSMVSILKVVFRMLFLVIVILKHIPHATKETFMKYFIFSCCLYICGTIIMLIFPGVKNVFYELVKEGEHAKTVALESFYKTRYGWAGFSGFEHTFKCVLAMVFNDYLISKSIKRKDLWLKLGISLLLLVGTLFYGRIGLLFGMLILAKMLIVFLIKRPKILMIVVCIGVVGIGALLVLQSRSTAVKEWFDWAFDLFINFFETGKLETTSSNMLLQDMIFLPEWKTILLGDGRYTTPKGTYYMSTDSGIMRPMLFGGIIFATVRYLSIGILLAMNILKKDREKAERTLYVWLLLLCIVFEIKGEIIFPCLTIVMWIIVTKEFEKWSKKNGKRLES